MFDQSVQKDWTGGTQGVMATLNASGHSAFERGEHDYYATPDKAVLELMRIETFSGPIWECACGELAITKAITDTHGIEVRSSDIVDRAGNEVFDFLSIENQQWGGDIVTNPPFAKATEFLEKALSIVPHGRKIALFLRIQFLEGVKRRGLFDRHPPVRVWVSSHTLRCAKNGDFANATGNASTYAWFVWEKGFQGTPALGWFN